MKTIFIYVALLFCLQGYAQHNIVAAEYFLGDDPGIGQGIPIAITPGSTIETTIQVPVAGLETGIHKLYLRVKNSNNKWSLYVKKNINVIDETTYNLVAAEYFFDDDDPGLGNGTPITFTAAPTIDTELEIPFTGLEPGPHQLYVRVKNSNDVWSLYLKKPIMVLMINDHEIVGAEYFFDDDPGLGNGTPITFTPASTIDTELEIPFTGLEPGPHQLYVRVKNSNDVWSLYLKKPIMVLMINDHEIVKAEYFFDMDPGLGNAFPIDLEDAANFNQPISVPIPDTLSFGVHNFFLRVKNSNEKWSLYARSVINVSFGVGIEELSFQTEVYPNPVTDFLNITIENALLERVRIIDFNGKCLLLKQNPSKKIDLKFLASGVYLIQIKTDKGEISEKIVKL